MGLALSTTSIPGDLRTKLATIAGAGFDTVELHMPDFLSFEGSAAEARALVVEHGLRLGALKSLSNFEGLAGDARQRATDRLAYHLDLAAELGASVLMLVAQSSAGASDDLAQISADFAEAANMAAERNIKLALLSKPRARALRTDHDAMRVISKVGHSNLGLALNTYFSLITGTKPAQYRDLDARKLFHVQISDAPRVDPDLQNLNRDYARLPGLGSLNIAGLVQVLAQAGYEGDWAVARVNDATPRPDGPAFAKDAYRAAVHVLDQAARRTPDLNLPIPSLPPRAEMAGVEFIEFAVDGESRRHLTAILQALCFRKERQHLSKSVELWRQGAINIVINTETTGHAAEVFEAYGPSVCDMGFRVKNAPQAVQRATALGTPDFTQELGDGELNIPAIRGVGGTIVHFIDENSELHRVWDIEFAPSADHAPPAPAGLRRVDHIAQTMRYSDMQSWLLYYESTFTMAAAPNVNVADPSGVIHSQALTSPEGEVRLNLNGAAGAHTFADSFLAKGSSAGVQHIAFVTDDIFETAARLRESGFEALPISPNYYEELRSRFGLEEGFLQALREAHILYDREGNAEYFQLYSRPLFNGFFFEIVERRSGYSGFGAVNATARLAAQGRDLA